MQKRAFIYRTSSIVLFAAGITLLVNSRTGIAGAVVGVSAALSLSLSFILGLAFMIAAVVMFAAGGQYGAPLLRFETLEEIMSRRLKKTGRNPEERAFVILDSNFLIKSFDKSFERVSYVRQLISDGYHVIVPDALKNELPELNGIGGIINFSKYEDYKDKEGEMHDLLKETKKYKNGTELLKYNNAEEVPQHLYSYFKPFLLQLAKKINSGESKKYKKFDWNTIKDYVEHHFVNVESDSDILASATWGKTTESTSPKPVFLVSLDDHLKEAVKKLDEKYSNLKRNLFYIYPKEEAVYDF